MADFGLTSEGTSRLAITTRNSRGTGGYRAPELLEEFPKYINKVDIWALGCILYELTAAKKAFADDYMVLLSSDSRSSLQIELPSLPEILLTHLSECIYEILERDPQQRPSISILLPLIESYSTILKLKTLDVAESIPAYDEWKKLVSESSGDALTLLSQLADLYWRNQQIETEIHLLESLLDNVPQIKKSRERLAQCYKSIGNKEKVFELISELTFWNPNYEQLLSAFSVLQTKVSSKDRTTARAPKEADPEHTQLAAVTTPRPIKLKNDPGLISMAKLGDAQGVRKRLEDGADPNSQDEYFGNALQAASYAGHETVVRLLLEKGADINAQGGHFGNSLQAAAAEGKKAVVRLLLEKGADVNAQGGHFGSAIQAASNTGIDVVIRMLTEKGANINVQGGVYGSALQAASYHGYKVVTRLLIEKGADINAQGGVYGNALQAALSGGHNEVAQLLLERGANVNAQGGIYGNALQASSCWGNEGMVRLLLEKGADINAQGGHFGNALVAASKNGHKTVVRLLLANGADANVQGGYFGDATHAATIGGHKQVVQLLKQKSSRQH